MSYLDRVRELKYTSPSGAEFTPYFDDVERESSKKAGIHEVPQSDFAVVQDNGNEAGRHKFTLYFTGPDYDQIADAFYDALGERGPGILSHPRWGDIRVLPLNRSQKEGFVNDMGAAIFSVEFVEAPVSPPLAITARSPAAIQSAADLAATASKAEAAAQMVADNATKAAQLKRTALAAVTKARDGLKAMSSALETVRREVQGVGDSIERGIDDLLADPVELAEQTMRLLRLPAREVLSIKAKVDGYALLISEAVPYLTEDTAQGEAAAVVLNLFGLSLAVAESTTLGTPASREEAIAVRSAMNSAMLQAEAGIQAAESCGYVTSPETLAQLAALRTNASAYLLEAAFTLPTLRRYVTETEETAITLAHRLLGDPERMDEIIDLNGFGGTPLIPIGREVRYYA